VRQRVAQGSSISPRHVIVTASVRAGVVGPALYLEGVSGPWQQALARPLPDLLCLGELNSAPSSGVLPLGVSAGAPNSLGLCLSGSQWNLLILGVSTVEEDLCEVLPVPGVCPKGHLRGSVIPSKDFSRGFLASEENRAPLGPLGPLEHR
jgi:hypothetical protein